MASINVGSLKDVKRTIVGVVRQQSSDPWTLPLAPYVLSNILVLPVSIYEMRLIFIYFFKDFGIQNCFMLISCLQAKLWQIFFVLLAWESLWQGSEVGVTWCILPCSSERGGLRAALRLIHAVPQYRHSIYCRAAMRQRRTQARGFFYTLGAKSSNADPLIKGIMKTQKMILLVYLTTSTAWSLTW